MDSGIRTVAVLTRDRYLFQKIRLDAPHGVEVLFGNVRSADLYLVDIDTADATPDGALTMSRVAGKASITLPFPLGTVEKIIKSRSGGAPLTLSEGERCAYLRGERIRLTEVEYSLLRVLKAHGDYVSREELLRSVWGEGTDSGVVNVYIHYLREKLEGHGEKIILSSRKCGYRIDEKYLGGEENA